MFGSWLLVYCRRPWLCSALLMTKVSSTNLSHWEGGWGGAKGFYLKLFHENVGYKGTDGGPHSCTLDLFLILTLEEEVSVGKAEQRGLWPATMPNWLENQRQRNRGFVLMKPIFNRHTPDRYVKLLNFQLEVINILQTRKYGINEEERIPVTKNWLDQEGLLLMKTFMQGEKKCKTTKGLV